MRISPEESAEVHIHVHIHVRHADVRPLSASEQVPGVSVSVCGQDEPAAAVPDVRDAADYAGYPL